MSLAPDLEKEELLSDEDCVVMALELTEGDLVDLDSCPYVNREEHLTIEFEYAEVNYVESEGDCIVIGFEGIDNVGYSPYQRLTAVLR